MAGKHLHKYPPDDELREACAKNGYTAVAKSLGIPSTTLRAHLDRRGIPSAKQAAAVEVGEIPAKPVDDPDRLRVTSLEAQVDHLKRENSEYGKKLATQEELFDRIVETTKLPSPKPKLKARKKQHGSKPSNSIIAPIYDQQFGQFVRPSDTPGRKGNFSLEVFDERLERYVEGLTGIIAKRADGYGIKELIIPFGGDQVEGDEIFAGQPWQLEIDPVTQVWELHGRMLTAITEIVRFAREDIGIEHIAIYGVTGNHGKVGGRKSGARPASYNWDLLFLKFLFASLQKQPIDEFAIEPLGIFFYAAGHEIQAVHGDEIRGWGGIPFYGLTRFDGRSMRLHNRLYRYLIMGHHHQPADIPNGAGRTIICPDWVGANNLSRDMAAASRPAQKVLFLSEKWGMCGMEDIWFTEAHEAYEPTKIYGAEGQE